MDAPENSITENTQSISKTRELKQTPVDDGQILVKTVPTKNYMAWSTYT